MKKFWFVWVASVILVFGSLSVFQANALGPVTQEKQEDENQEQKESEEAPADEEEAEEEAETAEKLFPQVIAKLRRNEFDAALETLGRVRQLDPDNFQYAMLHARVLNHVGGKLRQKSFAHTYQAAEITRELMGKDEVQGPLREMLAKNFYDAACCHCLEGQFDQSLELLNEAFENGFSDVSIAEADNDLAGLRDNPKFGSLLKTHREAIARRLAKETERELADFESFDFDFALPSVDGETISLADYKGQVVIADIWGTWCPPCREEIPSFVSLQETYGDKGLQIIGLNYEHGDDEEKIIAKIKDFMAENNMNYPCVIGDDETRGQVENFQGFPTTIFIDKSGKVRLTLVGLHSKMKLESVVTTLLDETPAAETESAPEGDSEDN